MNVQVFRGKPAGHVDERREIRDTTLNLAVALLFPLMQVKMIDFFPEAVAEKLAVGNHYHTVESNRHEFFVILGGQAEESDQLPEPACLFRHREPGKEIQEEKMMAGDACLIPPGNSHSFLPLRAGIQLLGLSNLEYDSAHDVSDKLF